jgi:hypothetical protein
MDQEPARIREEMKATRASIDNRLELLDQRVRRLHPRNYLGWVAVGAVATGASLALRGWWSERRVREMRRQELSEPLHVSVISAGVGKDVC